MEDKKPLLLISNDDGYQAKGLRVLVEAVRHLGDVLVCAPEGGRSGMACAFSATTPLTLTKRTPPSSPTTHHPSPNTPHPSPTTPHPSPNALELWSCNGTPVDCVKMALAELCPRRPDIIIGGINHGDNASVNVHYSGTMGVVLEGCMKYIPSVAYSLCNHEPDADFSPLVPYIKDFTARVLQQGLPQGVCLNVNFPNLSDFQGIRVCRMAHGTWGNEVVKCRHPRNFDYWWMVGSYTNDEPEADDTDNWALQHGYIAITPTRIDVTAYEAMDTVRNQFNL